MATRARKSKSDKNNSEEFSINESDEEIMTSSNVRKSISIKSSEKGFASSTPSRSKTGRAPSPLHIERLEEKEELAHLNDRLAYYIDYVRNLEIAKEKLTQKIKSISRVDTIDLDKLKESYDDELRSLRRLVDDLSKDKITLELALKNANEEATQQKRRAERKESENHNLQRRIDILERELSKCKNESERYSTLVSQHDALEKRCAKLSKDLDAEILLRTDLENRNVTIKEQMEFNDRVYNEERMKLTQVTYAIEEEVEDRAKAEYESKLAEELRQIREETADEFESYKMDFESSFSTRMTELRQSSAQNSDNERKSRDEMMMYRMKSEKLEQELASKSAEVDLLNKRLKDMENSLNLERREFQDQIERMRLESEHLRDELEVRLKEFSDLMSTKIALDQEILMYRKMLEGEESRCNLTIKSSGDTSFSAIAGIKRRRIDDSMSGSNLVSCGRESYKVETSAKGGVEFSSKPDCTGKFVKLLNKTDKDICIGGWTLNYKADNMETTYKFHHNLHIKANSECTVWSSDANETHNPPHDLVMKGQRFFTGNKVSMALLTGEDSEEARCLMSKETIRSTGYHFNRKIASRSFRKDDTKNCISM